MTPELDRLRETERWIAWVRLAAVPFAIVEVGLLSTDYPPGYEGWAWATTGLLAVAGVGFFLLSRWVGFARAPRLIGLLGLTVDTVIVSAFVLIYQYEIGSPVNELFFVLLVEAAVRYGIRGGLLMPLAIAPLLALAEWWRESKFDNPPHGYQPDHILFPWGLLTLTGMIVGWLVDRLRYKTTTSEAQVVQAELLREPSGFNTQELELVGLLGRLVASAVQNIRAYEAERNTVEELRRLSALRADFVSLVSHELRAPMASVVGSAQTLRQRWRELSPDQRESFLALISSETERLAALVADVLDTSRIDAGTFTASSRP